VAKSGKLARELLQLHFENVGIAGIGDATGLRGSSTAGSLYLNLYSAFGGAAVSYIGYVEVASARAASVWMFGSGYESSVDAIVWGTNTGHSTVTARWWGVSRTPGAVPDWYAPISGERPRAFAVTAASLGSNRILCPGHGHANGTPVTMTSLDGATFPTSHPTSEALYYVVGSTTDDLQLALSVGGAAVTLGSVGAGQLWSVREVVIDRGRRPVADTGTLSVWPERVEVSQSNGVLTNFVSAWGISITFEDAITGGPVLVGEYLRTGSKKYWAHAPNGLRVTGKTPAFIDGGPRTSGVLSVANWDQHGMMTSRSVRTTEQGLDATIGMSGSINAPFYNRNINMAAALQGIGTASLVVSANGSANAIIAIRSQETPFGRPQVYSMLVLTVVAAIPPVGSFRPCVGRNPESFAKPIPPYNVANIRYDRLPSLAIPSDPNQLIPTWAKINSFLDGEWYESPNVNPGGSILKQYSRPQLHMTVDGSRTYGQDVAAAYSACLAKLMLAYPQAEKEIAVQEMCQIGYETYLMSAWDRHTSTALSVSTSGHWGENAGQGCLPVLRMLFAGIMLDDVNILNECKWLGPAASTLAATKQWFHEHGQYFKVGESGTGNFGQCGYGATPPGGANWIPDGTAEWGVAHRLQVLTSDPLSDVSAWDEQKLSHPSYPKQATGENCPIGPGGNTTQYRLCCTANVTWIADLYLRWLDSQGLAAYEDYLPPALGWYLRDTAGGGRGFIEQNVAWGQPPENPAPAPVTQGALHFFEVMRGPLGNAGICKLVKYAYGDDYTTYPLPTL
jgi:hypothetical protein